MEGCLAKYKKAVPRCNGSPNLETQAYVPVLAGLLERHEENGFRNPLVKQREDLEKAGVPVMPFCRKHKRRRYGSSSSAKQHRPHMLYANIETAAWKKLNPMATDTEVNAKHSAFLREWPILPDTAQDAWNCAHPQPEVAGPLREPHSEGEDEERIAPNELYFPSNPVYTGDSKWPVAIKHIQKFLGECGMAKLVAVRRWDVRTSLVFSDGGKVIPPAWVAEKRYSCDQAHRGLCFERDTLVYEASLKLASTLERFLTADIQASYIRIEAFGADPDHSALALFSWFVHKRARRPYAQETCYMLACERIGDGHVAFKGGGDPMKHQSISVWSIAKSCMAVAGVARVTFSKARCTRCAANPRLSTVVWDGPVIELWPAPPPRERRPRAVHAIDLLGEGEGERAKPPRTGGIRAFVGDPRRPVEPKGLKVGKADSSDDGGGSASSASSIPPDLGDGGGGGVAPDPGGGDGGGPAPPEPDGDGAGGGGGDGAGAGGAGAGGGGAGPVGDPRPHLAHPNGYIILNDSVAAGFMDMKAMCRLHHPCSLTRKLKKLPFAEMLCFLDCGGEPGHHKTNPHWRDRENRLWGN